jgi:hypothetical protein
MGMAGGVVAAFGLAVASYGYFLPYRLTRTEYETLTFLAKASIFCLPIGLFLGAYAFAVSRRRLSTPLPMQSVTAYKRILRAGLFAVLASLLGILLWAFVDAVHSTTPVVPNEPGGQR